MGHTRGQRADGFQFLLLALSDILVHKPRVGQRILQDFGATLAKNLLARRAGDSLASFLNCVLPIQDCAYSAQEFL